MRIKHEDAVVLEAIVRRTFNCERGGMGGFVDADHFEREPFDAAIIAIVPLWQRSNPKEIEEFLRVVMMSTWRKGNRREI